MNKYCTVKFDEAVEFGYMVVSEIPILDKMLTFDAKFTYDCGRGEQKILCKHFGMEIKLGELKQGKAEATPKLTYSPEKCEPLNLLQLVGIYK